MSTPGIPVVDSSLLRRGTSQQQDGTQPLSFSLLPMHSKEIGQLPHGSETLSGLGAPCRKALPRPCRGSQLAVSIYLLWNMHVRPAQGDTSSAWFGSLFKRNAQLCDCSQCVGRPGNHCFDFQPIAESAVRKDLQVELVLLVLWVITLTKSWERGNNFLNVVLF